MHDEEVRELLRRIRTVAVVGMSGSPDRDSYQVGAYLKDRGYRVVPVNPALKEVLGERAYPSLAAIPPEVQVDLVDVFRRSDAVPGIVEEALARSPLPKAIWLQLTVRHPESAARLQDAGVGFVQDRCVMVEHRRLVSLP
jgi:predicted CoA-binding protein